MTRDSVSGANPEVILVSASSSGWSGILGCIVTAATDLEKKEKISEIRRYKDRMKNWRK